MSDIQQAQERARLLQVEELKAREAKMANELVVSLTKVQGMAKCLSDVCDFGFKVTPSSEFLAKLASEIKAEVLMFAHNRQAYKKLCDEVEELRTDEERVERFLGPLFVPPI